MQKYKGFYSFIHSLADLDFSDFSVMNITKRRPIL